jgi:hypothetical protein
LDHLNIERAHLIGGRDRIFATVAIDNGPDQVFDHTFK